MRTKVGEGKGISKVKVSKNKVRMITNKVFIDNEKDMTDMVALLTRQGYKVKVEKTVDVDVFCQMWKLTFKESEEDYV